MSQREDNPEQTLDEFTAEIQQHLKEFKADWIANHAKTPEQWLMKMRAGDWFDQLLTRLS